MQTTSELISKKTKGILATIAVAFLAWGCQKGGDGDEKVLNLSVSAKIKGIDPIYASDLYSGTAVARIYEGLLGYHYLKRPFVLEPNLAAAMPEVGNNSLTYTFKLRQGVLFHDNQCFGKRKGAGDGRRGRGLLLQENGRRP